jgi:hypothetical protein
LVKPRLSSVDSTLRHRFLATAGVNIDVDGATLAAGGARL